MEVLCLAIPGLPRPPALIQIGQPAIPALLSIIATEEEPLKPWLASWCLREMDGWQITVLRLAAEKDQEPKRRQRLLAQAERIEKAYATPPPAQ